ncbi:MAG: N-acetyltransferase [Acidobacteria bacterium]|nr:N-acetyltransferase [Acidobacteriota bacterium]
MISLRPASSEDYQEIRKLNRRAFAGAEEADLVDSLRSGGHAVLELVAEHAGRIVGHILFSELPIVCAGRTIPAAALAPMAVEPAEQRRGIGGALIHMSIPMLAHAGFDAIVVLGHADYYPRFGFSAETAAGLHHPFPPGPHFMALELTPGVLEGVGGHVKYAPPFGL